jgi:hypothetical protein
MKALGSVLDIGSAFAPVDFNTADAATGHRIKATRGNNIMFVLYKGAGTAAADPIATIQEHTLSAAGTSQNLPVVTEFYRKHEATLDGDETWEKVTQAAAATVNMGDTSAEFEGIYAVEIETNSLSAGFSWLSVNIAATVANAQLVSGLYIVTGLRVQRAPELLGNLLNGAG